MRERPRERGGWGEVGRGAWDLGAEGRWARAEVGSVLRVGASPRTWEERTEGRGVGGAGRGEGGEAGSRGRESAEEPVGRRLHTCGEGPSEKLR